MLRSRITRRTLLERTALATTALVAAPLCSRRSRRRQALDRLLGPLGSRRATTPRKRSVQEWGEKNKVEVSIDYITSQGNKNLLTIAAEAQARVGP